MKTKFYRINVIALMIITSLFLGSCEKWIDPEINENPDAATDVPMSQLLPAIQLDMAYVVGGADMAGYTSVWMQYIEGSDRQFKTVNGYNMTQTDVNNAWNSLYGGSMMDASILIQKAEENASPHFGGAGKVLMAYLLGTATDLWGDIPYSDAFQGSDNFTPEYDSQEQIYETILTLLDEAIADLNPNNENEVPLSSDLIYGSDPAKWQKLAHTLKARYNMHLINAKDVNFGNVISDLNNGIMTHDDAALFFFGTSEAEANPMYQFITQRTGYAIDNTTYQGIMENDPRADVLYYGDEDDQGFWNSISSPFPVMTLAEALFLKAEAEHRGNSGDPVATVEEAINASLGLYGVSDENFVDSTMNEIDQMSGDALLEEIMTQKYRHMFMQPEAYVDYRRTGYPDLTPVSGDRLPLRYPYPSDEVDYNGENVPDVPNGIFTPLWWN